MGNVDWAAGEPDNLTGADCITYNTQNEKNYDFYCTAKKCSICRITGSRVFKISGVCKESTMDRFYVLQSNRQMIGYTHSKIVWSSTTRRLDILDTMKQNIFAYRNDSEEFPIGSKPWYFVNNECSDGNEKFRMMNLHLAVEQPGHFCCANGACIDSELRCDNVLHCDDHSDELNCDTLFSFYKNNLIRTSSLRFR